MSALLAFCGVWKVYPAPGGPRVALREVSFELPPGRRIAVVGRSGSGKSTLLHLAAGVDVPTAGQVVLEGQDLARLGDAARARLRRDRIGLVYQFFHLLPHLTVSENVALPELIAGESLARVTPRVTELLARVALAERADEPVDRLSGGEQQRVAICRALVRRPRLLLADEPTGNLDDETGRQVMDLMLTLVREQGSTLLYATHSADLARLADETWRLHSGVLEVW